MDIKSKKGMTEVGVIVVLAVVFAVFVLYSQGIIPKLTGLIPFAGEDAAIPLNITFPVGAASYPSVSTFNWSWNETLNFSQISSCWVSNDSGVKNYTVNCLDNKTSVLTTSVGSNNIWKIWANDTDGNNISRSVTFTIAPAGPSDLFAGIVPLDKVINITYPENGKQYNTTAPDRIIYTINESVTGSVTHCYYTTDQISVKQIFECGNPTFIQSREGLNTWTIFVKDDSATPKEASKSVSFTYQPDVAAPFSLASVGGSPGRHRSADIPGVGVNTSDSFLIQPNVYGNITYRNADSDYILTGTELSGKTYAYALTDKSNLLKINLENGEVEKNLTITGLAPKMAINKEKGIIYIMTKDGTTFYSIDAKEMKLSNKTVMPSGVKLNDSMNFVIKGDKIFIADRTANKVRMLKIVGTNTTYNNTINLPTTTMRVMMGITDVEGTELIALGAFLTNNNRLIIINSTNNKTVINESLNCTIPLTDIVSKSGMIYYMCKNASGAGTLVEWDINNISNVGKRIYGDVDTDRLKNVYKNAFAVGGEWLYYGTNLGITAVKRNNLGSEAVYLGTIIRKNNLGNVTSITVSRDLVYATTEDGWLYALNKTNITKVFWSVQLVKTGTKPRLFDVIVSSSNSIIAFGGDNNIYRMPKVTVGIIVTPTTVEKEWIVQGGNQQRTRYVNTSGVKAVGTSGEPAYRGIVLNPATEGNIVKDPNKDSVLTFEGNAYVLTNKGLNKVSLGTGEVEIANQSGITNMVIDPGSKILFGVQGAGNYLHKFDLTGGFSVSNSKYVKGYYVKPFYTKFRDPEHVGDCCLSSITDAVCTAWESSAQCDGYTKFKAYTYSGAYFEPTEPIVTKDYVFSFMFDKQDTGFRAYGTCNIQHYSSPRTRIIINYKGDLSLPANSFWASNIITDNLPFWKRLNAIWGTTAAARGTNSLPTLKINVGQQILSYTKVKDLNITAVFISKRAMQDWGINYNIPPTGSINILNFDAFSLENPSQVISSPDDYGIGSCELSSQPISKSNYLYFICDKSKLRIYNLNTPTVEPPINYLPKPINSQSAFAMNKEGNKLYYGTADGKLGVINLLATPTLTISLVENFNGNITAIAVVNDMIYAGTNTGMVYGLNASNPNQKLWEVKVTGENEPGITSIIIPAENSMLAVGGYNDLYLFGEAVAAVCGNNFCDAGIGENCSNCPSDCEACPVTPGVGVPSAGCIGGVTNGICSGSEVPATCGDCHDSDSHDTGGGSNSRNPSQCLSGDTSSSWRDTDEPSEDNCMRVFGGVNRKCCPWGQTCSNFGAGDYKCILDGTDACMDYKTEAACADYNPFAAFQSVDLSQGEGFCGSLDASGVITECECSWSAGDGTCQPGWRKVQIGADGTETTLQSCQYQCSESGCLGGIKTVSCSASGVGGCDPTSDQTSCYVPTEIPFFTLWNAIITLAVLVGLYYVLLRRK